MVRQIRTVHDAAVPWRRAVATEVRRDLLGSSARPSTRRGAKRRYASENNVVWRYSPPFNPQGENRRDPMRSHRAPCRRGGADLRSRTGEKPWRRLAG